MTEVIAILVLLGYIIFKDIIHRQEVRDLQVMLFEGMTPEQKLAEETEITEEEQELDNFAPLTEIEPERVLKALAEEADEEEEPKQ